MLIQPKMPTKLVYYTEHLFRQMVPRFWWRRQLPRKLEAAASEGLAQARSRVDYYLGLNEQFDIGPNAKNQYQLNWEGFWLRRWVARMALRHLGRDWNKASNSTYYADFNRYARYFDPRLRFAYRFGDNRSSLNVPSFTKSRRIGECPPHGVLLKLNEMRHFKRVDDALSFEQKQPGAVFRGACHQPWRKDFLRLTRGMAQTDFGDTRSNALPMDRKPFLSFAEQLRYRFVVSIEGNDVATNLKWIFSSNSLCMMPKPKIESWFMEGRLVSGVHFVELRDDFSDLPEKMEYYNRHPEEALTIIEAAKNHRSQFDDPLREQLINLMVMERYFKLSGQLS